MDFSQQPPTAPGLYWYRLVEDGRAYHTHVWRYTSDFPDLPFAGELVANAGGEPKPVTRFGRWWSTEFLPEPEGG